MNQVHDPPQMNANAHRLARGLTQHQIAEAIGSRESTVSKWFKGLRPNEINETRIVNELNRAGDKLGLAPLTGNDLWGPRG